MHVLTLDHSFLFSETQFPHLGNGNRLPTSMYSFEAPPT